MNHRSFLAPHQEAPFADLLRTAHLFFHPQWHHLPISPRFHSLIVGSTGTGKTFLGRALAAELDVPLFSLSLSAWMVLGAPNRGAAQTWPTLLEFIHDRSRGIIFLDEVDKLSQSDQSSWIKSLKVEVFALLDGRIPTEMEIPRDSIGSKAREDLEEKLRTRFFILGAGAFQSVWDRSGQKSGTIGFGNTATGTDHAFAGSIAEHIPRELANRFRSQLLLLPPLTCTDYENLIESAARELPSALAETFVKFANEGIPAAEQNRQGFRLVEEALLTAIQASQESNQHRNSAKPHRPLTAEPCPAN
jgi:SpoVK/Ycf46/Vps4 family AAA+-type ATPase